LSGIPLRTTYLILGRLLDAGIISKERRGMSVLYRIARSVSKDDLAEILSRNPANDAPPYMLARSIAKLINRYRILADLVGAAKIHLEVPTHQRITHDVDIIATREWARNLVLLMQDILGLSLASYSGTHIDYRLEDAARGVTVDIMVNGFREEGRLVWDLSKYLRERGRLWLEHAVVGKLARRGFREADSYDVLVSIPRLDIERLSDVIRDLADQMPTAVDRIENNLEKTKEYGSREMRDQIEILRNKVESIEKMIKTMRRTRSEAIDLSRT
jgi:DNA-binding transcriptional ArsR family regulator